jgi:hypothetical protein
MKSARNNGNWSLPFMMKVLVWCFTSDACKVMTVLFLVMFVLVLLELAQQLPSKCYVVFSAISQIRSTLGWDWASSCVVLALS